MVEDDGRLEFWVLQHREGKRMIISDIYEGFQDSLEKVQTQ